MSSIGQRLKRFEDPRLVAGKGSYVDDIALPGMLHAHFLRSTHAHARIRSIDASAARNQPGVVTVLTGEDTADVLGDIPINVYAELQPQELNAPLHPVLARDKVCYVGQPVAVVVASSRYLASDAAERIRVDYEPLPALADPLEAMREDATPIHPHIGTNMGLRIYREGGDVDAAFAAADRIVRQRFDVQRLAPVPMETRGMVAHYQPQEDFLTIWDSTQTPHLLRTEFAKILKLPETSVRVIAPDVGGGFGEKGPLFPEDVAVAYLSVTLGRPVKWVADRQENMLGFHARGHKLDIEAAIKDDGSILGMRIFIVADLGAYFLLSTAAIPLLASQRIAGPYKTPAMRVEVVGVITNKPTTGPYRGAGGPESASGMERILDLIARDLGMDPAEVRRRNFIPPDAFPHETPTGLTYDSGSYERGLDRALDLAKYHSWRKRAREMKNSQGRLIGVGLATIVKQGGVVSLVENARVSVERSGEIIVYTGVSPHGQGTETAYAQIVADVLGVSPSEARVIHGDTALVPSGGGTNASRGSVVGAPALFKVLQEARRKLSVIASHLLNCPVEDIEFGDGQVFNSKNSAQTLTFAQVVEAAHDEEKLPPEVEAGLDFSGRYVGGSTYAFGAHVAVVEVDRDTGQVEILEYAAVHDCGRIINPTLVEGQMQGGIVQGIGQALTEDMVYDPDGQPMAGSLLDYALPIAEDIPSILLDTIETPSPNNPLGTKGAGEVQAVAAPVAVTNAVLDALSHLGIRHIDTPLTSEKVLRAIWQAQA